MFYWDGGALCYDNASHLHNIQNANSAKIYRNTGKPNKLKNYVKKYKGIASQYMSEVITSKMNSIVFLKINLKAETVFREYPNWWNQTTMTTICWDYYLIPYYLHTPHLVTLSIFTIFTNIIQILERNIPKHEKYHYPSLSETKRLRLFTKLQTKLYAGRTW